MVQGPVTGRAQRTLVGVYAFDPAFTHGGRVPIVTPDRRVRVVVLDDAVGQSTAPQ